MAIFGSAYPVGKLILNTSLPPMLMASIRMGIVFLCLIPFWKFKIPDKKYFIPLIGFSFSMGVGVFTFMNLALQKATSCITNNYWGSTSCAILNNYKFNFFR